MRSLPHSLFALMIFCLLLGTPSFAAGAEAVLLNGSDGSYWGLSKADVASKAPGSLKEEKNMGAFTALLYTDAVNGIPLETFYTLKDDKCWKISIITKATKEDAIIPLFESLVAELTKRLGAASETKDLKGITKSAAWDTGETTAYVYCDFDDRKVSLNIFYESAILVKGPW